MTREELLNHFTKLRAKKITLTWTQFASAVSGADATTKAVILAAINNNNAGALDKAMFSLARSKKIELARAEVDAIAVDDNLTVTELTTLLS